MRIEDMCLSVINILKKYKPQIIVIEKLNVGRNMVSVRCLAKIIGAVYCYSILNDDVFYYEMSPSEWRSKLGFQGGVKCKREDYKRMAVEYVLDNYKKKVIDDEAEAICVGIGYINLFL